MLTVTVAHQFTKFTLVPGFVLTANVLRFRSRKPLFVHSRDGAQVPTYKMSGLL